MLNVVLLEPEIPLNTGNIGRTCVAVGARLHLIYPLGFQIGERAVKRAGMDYWHRVDLRLYDDFEDFMKKNPDAQLFLATTKARRTYAEVKYGPDAFIMFGKESAGIPEEILKAHEEQCVRIPMLPGERSLNLANSVSVILFEALRQNGFPGLSEKGELHRLSWDG